MKIGVMVESFRLGFRGGVEKAAALGAAGIQKYCTGDELNWTDAQIKEALDIVKSNGLVFSAICGDFGYGFDDPDRNPEMIEKSKKVLDIAKKLECDIVRLAASLLYTQTPSVPHSLWKPVPNSVKFSAASLTAWVQTAFVSTLTPQTWLWLPATDLKTH